MGCIDGAWGTWEARAALQGFAPGSGFPSFRAQRGFVAPQGFSWGGGGGGGLGLAFLFRGLGLQGFGVWGLRVQEPFPLHLRAKSKVRPLQSLNRKPETLQR